MKVNIIAVGGFLMVSAYGYAADPVSLNVTGNIVASPCQVSSDSVTKSVDLGQSILSSDLKTAGNATSWTSFTIDLNNCPAATTIATMTMHGTADTDNPNDMYKSTGTANNIAVQLQSQAGDLLGNGKSITGNIINNACSFLLHARAYTQNGEATPGTIVSTVTATFVYN